MGGATCRFAVRALLFATLAIAAVTPAGALAISWSAVTGATSSIQEVGKVRAPDGTLHVVWARATPGSGGATTDIVHAVISAGGSIGTQTVIASAFSGASNPAIVNLPGGALEVFFGSIQCTNQGCPTGLFTSISRDGGSSWTAPASLFDQDQVYASNLSAATLSDGTPFETWSHTTGVTVHRGTDPATPDFDFQPISDFGCCGYQSNLAADGAGHLRLAWDSNASGHPGVWSQAVDPSTGAPSGSAVLMPGSVVGTASHAQASGNRVPIVALPGQSSQFFVAYPGGYPTLSKVLLWRAGSASAATLVNEPQDHNAVSLATDASARLWVFWTSPTNRGPHVFAQRITATAAEPAIDLGAPAGTQSIYALDGDVSPAGAPEALALVGLSDGTTGTFYARGPQSAPVQPPVLGKSFAVYPVSGTIYVKLPGGSSISGYGAAAASAALVKGKGFVPLTQARSVPAGAVVDSRHGSLKVVAATGHGGKTQSGVFRLGLFKLTQARAGASKGLTSLSLVEGAFPGAPSFAGCKRRAAADGSPHAHAALSNRVLQTLRASAHGRFRTRGRFSAGTVRGTEWGTRDRCDGTLTIVRRGTVLVRDFGRRKTIPVHAGHTYLAKAFGPR